MLYVNADFFSSAYRLIPERKGKCAMKKLYALALIACAACCFLAAGCEEMYYDATVEPGRIAASGYNEIYNVECCVVFKAGFLRRYAGWNIVAIKLFNPVDNQTISYAPVLYENEAGASSPAGEPVYRSGPAAIEADTWETIAVDPPVTIDASRDYWAGYGVATIPGINLLAQGSKPNYGNSRISFNSGISFQKASGNFLVRIVVRR
jgi:hypothetical protein